MKNSSSNGSLASRGDARISVAEKWANRRQQQLKGGHSNTAGPTVHRNSDVHHDSMPSQPKGGFSIPPLCVLLRRSWHQTINGFIQQQSDRNDKETASVPQKRSTNVCTKQENSKRVSFPSVLSILKANAVKLQVESILREEDEDDSEIFSVDNTTEDRIGGVEKKSIGNGLSILPANVSDFTTSAVNHMSESRSRAFHLLDFSAIVHTYTIWRKRLLLQKHHNVQMVYSARHNCNARLFQLLRRLGIGFRVATKYDLTAVRESIVNCGTKPKTKSNTGGVESGEDDDSMIWDDTSILVKPNSFYRTLLLDRSSTNNEKGETTRTISPGTIPITVANAEEMERIHIQMCKMHKRRRQGPSSTPKLAFVLRLENDTNDLTEWKSVVEQMYKKSLELIHSQFVGVALELAGRDTTIMEKTFGTGDTDTITIEPQNRNTLLLEALSDLIEKWAKGSPPQVHLSNPITATEIESSVLEWIERHHKICATITIDVSRLLMANAAALCARIIGVKNNYNKLKSNEDASSIGKTDDTNRNQNAIQQHLYIDDGCYGSLSNYPNEGIPLPLKSQRLIRSLSATSKQLLETEQNTLVNTTVWGPTCK